MRPRSFEYYAPSSITVALDLLGSLGEAKILAGGQSLITLMKLRLASPKALIDINAIPGLSEIREHDGLISIGALTRYDQLEANAVVREKLPILSEAAGMVADQQVRNRGTIGGSLAHADPGADLPTACTATGATVVATSRKGPRTIPISEFFRGYFTTALRENEIIQEVRVPIPPQRSGGAYSKLVTGHNDFAIVSLAALVTVDQNSMCSAASLVLGGVAPTPVHAKEAEELLIRRNIDTKTIAEASRKASAGLNPPSDIRASAEYRSKMAEVLAKKALTTCLERAKGRD